MLASFQGKFEEAATHFPLARTWSLGHIHLQRMLGNVLILNRYIPSPKQGSLEERESIERRKEQFLPY